MNHARWIERLGEALAEAVRPLLASAPATALLDFPAHSNVGDSAIWLGALRLLRRLGAPAPCYQCDHRTYDRAALARRLGRGTILFTGGGSLGDLWERHLLFREQVIRDFPDNPIVQLPESIHFRKPASVARARATFDGHAALTILVRDRGSLEIARREFRAPSVLAPDLALALGPLQRPVGPGVDVLWLKRRDQEDRFQQAPPPEHVEVIDWVTETPTRWIRGNRALRQTWLRRPGLRPLLQPALEATNARAARDRLARGLRVLAGARFVVTDRLHGHVLATQLGIPNVVLDNSYGKVHRFVDTWTSDSPLVHRAASLEEAAALAARLVDDVR